MRQNKAVDKIPGFESRDGTLGEMRQIVAKLNAAADAYYNGRGELMTDFEWDALFDRLKALEAESGETVSETLNETVNGIVLELICKTPGIGSAVLVSAVGKSRATVMRAVALLKQRRLIEHCGSDKTGGYYAI